MLKIYRDNDGAVRSGGSDDDLPGHVIWMDLLNPDEKEIEFIQRRAKVRVPTRDALSEIEASSRLSREANFFISARRSSDTRPRERPNSHRLDLSSDLIFSLRFAMKPCRRSMPLRNG